MKYYLPKTAIQEIHANRKPAYFLALEGIHANFGHIYKDNELIKANQEENERCQIHVG